MSTHVDRRRFVQSMGAAGVGALNGYLRFTPEGVLISEARGVGIRVYNAGHWGSGGSLGQVTHHDRSNSKA